MSCALRDDVSIDTTIRASRLPSPSAATGHVLNRITNLRVRPNGSIQISPFGQRHDIR